MDTHIPTSRRRFLHTAAAISAFPFVPRFVKGQEAGPEGETEDFFYRLSPPDGPYIDSQRDNKAFAFHEGHILYSEDNSHSWARKTPFPDTENILWSTFLKNGNILFATRANLFLSTDNLATYRELTVKRPDGSDYKPHTPVDPEKPGWYFHTLDGMHTFDVDGKEIVVWGNYCNVLGGAVPGNIFYSVDGGETVKLAYLFGQNPRFQQADAKPEDFIGDPNNSVICRHIHGVSYNPDERAFYACTGDIDRGFGHEVHWLRGVYDWAADTWDWKPIISVDSNSRYKSGGFNFVGGKLYWASDANGTIPEGEKHDRGIFRCDPKDMLDTSKHELLFPARFEMANLIVQGPAIFSAHCAPASELKTGFSVSLDLGKTWNEHDLEQFGPRSPVRFHPKNSEGWMRVDLRKGWIERAEVLFIKPKA